MTDGDARARAAGPPVLQARGLTKAYGSPVLSEVDLDLHGGEVHALLGANGAGKSTLVRIVGGVTMADSGVMTVMGQPHAPKTRRAAEAAGVSVVLQEPQLVPTLTVAENLFLSRLPHRLGVIDRERLHAQATRALEAVGLTDLDPRCPVSVLSVGHRQLVEIAAALTRECRLLILDEPTAALSFPEVDRLFGHVRRLCDRGIAILFITHRIDEIVRIAHRVTVLRDGRVAGTRRAEGLDRGALIDLVTGGETTSAAADASSAARRHGDVALQVSGLCRGAAVRDVSFEVRRGEILGLSGLAGSGRTEVLRAIFGADPRDAGDVRLGDGRALPSGSPRLAVKAGLGMVPEDRHRHAVLPALSAAANITLTALSRLAWARVWIDSRREADTVAAVAARVGIRPADRQRPILTLSGGNQQKVVLARWLVRDCRVLLVDEPTRGIDVGAKGAIHHLLRDLASRGTALVVVSSEIDELMTLCDRIVVLCAGRVSGAFERGAFRETALVAAAFGNVPPGDVAVVDGAVWR